MRKEKFFKLVGDNRGRKQVNPTDVAYSARLKKSGAVEGCFFIGSDVLKECNWTSEDTIIPSVGIDEVDRTLQGVYFKRAPQGYDEKTVKIEWKGKTDPAVGNLRWTIMPVNVTAKELNIPREKRPHTLVTHIVLNTKDTINNPDMDELFVFLTDVYKGDDGE